MKQKLQDNLKRVRHRIEEACVRAGRRPDGVKLVVVTKVVSQEIIELLVELGVTDLGESRPQELCRRAAATSEWLSRQALDPFCSTVPPATAPKWHLIGHLQRNKVRTVLPWLHSIHSVDTLRLAEEIDNQSCELDKVTPVMLEVNVSGEKQKHGVPVAAAVHMADLFEGMRNVRICGLMTMAPLTDDQGAIRSVFERLKELFDEARAEGTVGKHFAHLSMGMSNDFELAIEAGATHVRIGSAVFQGIPRMAEPVETVEQ